MISALPEKPPRITVSQKMETLSTLKSIYKYLALFDVDARRLTVVKFLVVRNSKFLKEYLKKETACNFS